MVEGPTPYLASLMWHNKLSQLFLESEGPRSCLFSSMLPVQCLPSSSHASTQFGGLGSHLLHKTLFLELSTHATYGTHHRPNGYGSEWPEYEDCKQACHVWLHKLGFALREMVLFTQAVTGTGSPLNYRTKDCLQVTWPGLCPGSTT